MAKCPVCHAKQNYRKVLFSGSRKTLVCGQCGTSLRLNKRKLVPFFLLVNTVAVLLGFAMMQSRLYVDFLAILAIWIGISLGVYPLVVSLVASSERAS